MEITGKQTIAAPRTAVWDALNDPAILKNCLPGCESVERVTPDEFKVVLAAAIGPLRAKFSGKLRIADANPPSTCTMVFEGQGGAVGFGKGSSTVTLEEVADGTELSYSAKAQVGGKLAQVGSRLIDSVAKKMSDDFFNAFKKQLQAVAPAEAAAGDVPAPAAVPVSGSATAAIVAPAQAVAVPATSVAGASVPVVTPASTPSAIPNQAMTVPAWWLLVAAFVGAASAIAGAVLVR
ncbi:SRPBCC family protein [Lacisediminimonas profundi]|uniref:SRPBCC family protein n=1 Tax=Lacisediminimonas profundi TaxID=2603856 RepID=UPI00124BADDD|nr:carbon monoxide dehydrogenase subunit G [Lacisediminimonas profundi]